MLVAHRDIRCAKYAGAFVRNAMAFRRLLARTLRARHAGRVRSCLDGRARLGLLALCLLGPAGCTGAAPSAPPGGTALPDDWVAVTTVPLLHGVASGDVRSRSAHVWLRTSGPSRAEVEWMPLDGTPASAPTDVGREAEHAGTLTISTDAGRDYTATVQLENLRPATRYRYTVRARRMDHRPSREVFEESGSGVFSTPPVFGTSALLTFLWSGDLGGQQRCRDTWVGYPIFYRMLQAKPDFAILLGDTIYGDDVCPSPPNAPGSELAAATLEEYRVKHRYQRGSAAFQRFLASVPVYAVWDDHEVRNNFSGPHEPLMPAGRQAFLEYWPIGTSPEDPVRLYRKFRRGADAEFFLLDTRQYRDRNADQDGPAKTMLGTAQMPGNDSWARAADGTGFQTELRAIVNAILKNRVRNVVWLAGDVHYTQVNAYDPNGDGTPDFHEFIAGPLSAYPGKPVPPDPAFKPTGLHSEGGFYNFGLVTVNKGELRLEIVDEAGLPRFTRTFRVQ